MHFREKKNRKYSNKFSFEKDISLVEESDETGVSQRIKKSLGYLSPIEYRHRLGSVT